MTTNHSSLTPAEIDTELARIWNREQQLRQYKSSNDKYLAKWGGVGRAGVRPRLCEGLQTRGLAESNVKIVAELETLRAEAGPYEAEFSARRWNRYFLVTNKGGHVHRGMSCSTCYAMTQYAWLIDLAGCDEGEMVAEYGEKACTVCFPDAPVHPAFSTPGRVGIAEAAEKAAEAAEKAAKKAAKAERAAALAAKRAAREAALYA